MEEQRQSLAIESFSYSWLSNHRASSSSDHEGTSYDRFDRTNKGSNRLDFRFDVPSNHDSNFDHDDQYSIVDADELFSNGVLRPVFVNPSKTNNNNTSNHNNHMIKYSSSTSSSLQMNPSKADHVVPSIRRIRCCFMIKKYWRKSTSGVVRSFLGFVRLRPLICRHGIGCSRKSRSRVDDIDRREFEAAAIRSLDTSPQASPLILRTTKSSDCSSLADDHEYWCHDLESSNIYEAVLHCKRSIEK